MNAGEKYVVCDAGAGTVDLMTYEILEVGDTIKVKQVTAATGAKCGLSRLDQQFRRYLKDTHGEGYWTNERLIGALEEFELACFPTALPFPSPRTSNRGIRRC